MTARTWIGGLALAGLAWAASPAGAAEPAALVEDIANGPSGVDAMDYLPAGRVINLGANGAMVVDYLGSCVRETITGGLVTIGTEHSKIEGGSVRREKVQCDGGKLNLSTEQANQGGVVVFRGTPAAKGKKERVATLYGLAPIIDLGRGGKLVVERIDQRGERLVIEVGAKQLINGKFYDFASNGHELAAGAVYRASMNGRNVVFRIDAAAQPGLSPLAGRLLRL